MQISQGALKHSDWIGTKNKIDYVAKSELRIPVERRVDDLCANGMFYYNRSGKPSWSQNVAEAEIMEGISIIILATVSPPHYEFPVPLLLDASQVAR